MKKASPYTVNRFWDIWTLGYWYKGLHFQILLWNCQELATQGWHSLMAIIGWSQQPWPLQRTCVQACSKFPAGPPACSPPSRLLRMLLYRWATEDPEWGCLPRYLAGMLSSIPAPDAGHWTPVSHSTWVSGRVGPDIYDLYSVVCTGTGGGSVGASTWSQEERPLSPVTVQHSQGPMKKWTHLNSLWTKRTTECLLLFIQIIYSEWKLGHPICVILQYEKSHTY